MDGALEGHNALTFAFTTESGYEGSFATLSVETAPITMLSADAMTGATQISFFLRLLRSNSPSIASKKRVLCEDEILHSTCFLFFQIRVPRWRR